MKDLVNYEYTDISIYGSDLAERNRKKVRIPVCLRDIHIALYASAADAVKATKILKMRFPDRGISLYDIKRVMQQKWFKDSWIDFLNDSAEIAKALGIARNSAAIEAHFRMQTMMARYHTKAELTESVEAESKYAKIAKECASDLMDRSELTQKHTRQTVEQQETFVLDTEAAQLIEKVLSQEKRFIEAKKITP